MKCHAEELVVVPVSRLQNAREIYAALRDYWDEVKISG
jgi:hypothetical protein